MSKSITIGTLLSVLLVTTVHGGGGADFVRGNVNNDGSFDIGDAIAGLDYLFGATTLGCEDALDANDDGSTDIADVISILATLFSSGPDPTAPFPGCGADPTPDGLSCDEFDSCCGGPDAYEPNDTVAQCYFMGTIGDTSPFPAGTVYPGFETLAEEDWFCFHIDDEPGAETQPYISIPFIAPGVEIEIWITWFCTASGDSGFDVVTNSGASFLDLAPNYSCAGFDDSMDISFCVRQVGGPIACATVPVEWGDD